MTQVQHKAESWSKNILTWALLALAAYQFSNLADTVNELHELVIKHDTRLDNHDKEMDRMRDDMQRWYESGRTQLSQNYKP